MVCTMITYVLFVIFGMKLRGKTNSTHFYQYFVLLACIVLDTATTVDESGKEVKR